MSILPVKLVRLQAKPDAEGLYTFVPVFPCGLVANVHLLAKTPIGASKLLRDYMMNELDGRDDIREEA